MHMLATITPKERLLPVFTYRPGDTGIDWQGLSLLLSSNSVLIIILALMGTCLLFFSLLFVLLMYRDRQERLIEVARARVSEKEQDVRLLELQLIGEGKMPAPPPQVEQQES
jgi:hypothetical protein